MSGELSAAPYHSPGREGGREAAMYSAPTLYIRIHCIYMYMYMYIHVHRYTAVVSLVSNTK